MIQKMAGSIQDKIGKFSIQQLLSQFPGALFVKDQEGIVQFCIDNNPYSGLSNHQGKDYVGKKDSQIGKTKEADSIRSHDLEVLKSGKTAFYKESFTIPNGKYMDYVCFKAPFKNAQGQVIGIIGTGAEILKEVSGTTQVAIQEEMGPIPTHQIFKQIPGCLFVKDKNGIYVSYFDSNPQHPIPDCMGRGDQDLPWSEVADELRANDHKAMETERLTICYETLPLGNGTNADFCTFKAPFYDESGKLFGMIGLGAQMTNT